MLQGEGICMESLVDMISPFSVHSTTCNKGGLVYKPNKYDSLIQLEQGKEKQAKQAQQQKYFLDSEALPVEKPDFQLDQ